MDTFNYKSTRNISPSISMGQRFISKCIAARVCFEEAITSGGSAINRGCSLPDRCAVPLCQMRSTRNSMGGEEKSEGGGGGGLAENRYKMTIYVPCPVIYHPRARNFQLREEQIKTPSYPWLWLEASTCDLLASLSLSLSLSAKLKRNDFAGGETCHRGSLTWVEKQFVGISVGLIEYIFRKACCVTPDHGTIFYPRVNEPARSENWKRCYYPSDQVIEFFNRIVSVFL